MPANDLPDTAALHVANIKSGIVGGLIARADELGVPCEGWFAGLRLQRSQFDAEPPVYLSYRQACEIVRRALQSLPGEGHGLVLGQRQDIGHFGLLGLAMLTAENFGEALRIGIRYAPVTGAMMELQLEPSRAADDGDSVAVSARMRTREADIEPFLCEELFSSCLMLCRGLLGPDFRPLRVELAYPAPVHADAYMRVFDCEVTFDAGVNRVVIARRWLQAAMPAHNPASAAHVLALCREQMPAERPVDEIVSAVERLLRLQLADSPRLVDIAAELHLTERTLRRHLHDARTSYKAIHDRVRRETAEALLRRPGVRISEVGAAVGFRDAREFRRAFKRWTGIAPREMRMHSG
ncbi:AraC family transcriptional regulator [Marilutibacter chinensis]|uniref:AraC family transcriptional regulator n=1 Tax=Marilutibacter chinensis TaxID=2912247 RepID=A0ABS9HYB9_9GAMM|nr:AraC family transcriptional regulator [Lysobacter chinensis]MCF7223846.1 AraC family transcriptional regulator [Lysobacter chinensis]